ncbi:uncharacterized protein FA14DRAFT_176743 [Meira miltonrushii]|uniref:Uncharacterized protein n=1 Tax=Meira miltonrushii TaxID=1280837 RepID=A0A316VK68_9BASI|nr:uncharacterized protein FA14DRAFT_176743 [Meira miltonrushii]PWN37448.1 hypothetical protein FA14DRAFT_176743 [Meira miltonrushii]
MVSLSYLTFVKAHGSQLAFLEALMQARDDLEKSDVTTIMEGARRKVKQENLSEIPEGGITIIGRVAKPAFLEEGASDLHGATKALNGSDPSSTVGWTALAASARLMGAGWRQANIPPVSST